MKSLIAYYSYTGNTAKMARKLAEKRGTHLLEVRDINRPGLLRAYTAGGIAALKGIAWETQPFDLEIGDFDHITIMSPVWAGRPVPAINSLLAQLPSGKRVEVIMVSASGKSNCRQRLEALLRAKDCTLVSFKNVCGKLAKQLDMPS